MPTPDDWRAEIRARLSSANIDPAHEADIVDELAQHLEDETADLTRRGVSRGDARERLLAVLDDPTSGFPNELLKRRRAVRARDASPIGGSPSVKGFFASVWHDAVYGARSLLRARGLTATIILSLGVVIGANTAIFGLIYNVLLRPLPVPHPEQLVAIRPFNGGQRATVRWAGYKTLIQTPGLPSIETYALRGAAVTAHGEHTDQWVELLSGGFFNLIGVAPLLGRTIAPSDEATSAPVAVVSEDYWRQYLGADSSAVGKPITIDDVQFTLIGVMPHRYAGVFFAHRFALAIPFTAVAALDESAVERSGLSMIARLPGGAGDRVATARLSTAFLQCCMNPPPAQAGARSSQPTVNPGDPPYLAPGPFRDSLNTAPHLLIMDASTGLAWGSDFRGQYERILIALMGGVVLLLVIACANVGALLLARATARQREFAVRLSLGASRMRMLRQLLTESLELALAGALLGLVFAWLGTSLLLHNLPGNALQLGDVIAWRVSPAILAFTSLAAMLCTVVAGVWPARRASRADILTTLTGADRARARARGVSVDGGLAVAQMSLALVLVTTAALFVATLRNLTRNDGGYHTQSMLLARIEKDSVTLAAQRIIDDLARLPGVDAVSISLAAPVINDYFMWIQTEVPGWTPVPNEKPPETNFTTPGYFAATGIGLRAGRDFTPRDDGAGEPVVIVTAAFARHYFPNRDPVGQSLIIQMRTRLTARIVGVANDALYTDFHKQPSEMWYMPLAQWNANAKPQKSVVVAVRTSVDPVSLAPLVRRVLATEAPDVNIRKLSSVGQLMDDALAKERFAAALASLFGAVALGLAVLGVYGVVAYSVARRTAEIGVRMALGATARDAVRLVMRQTVALAVIGIAVGLPLAYAASRAVASQLFGVNAGDTKVMIGTALALAAAGLLAGFVPSRRAARVDPIIALRSE